MTNDKGELNESGKTTKASNNTIVLYSLTSIAMLCAGISAGVLYYNPDGAKDVLAITFAPVMIIVGGLIGFIKS